jgi:hypothetical protein
MTYTIVTWVASPRSWAKECRFASAEKTNNGLRERPVAATRHVCCSEKDVARFN